jgi:hypothetical protein
VRAVSLVGVLILARTLALAGRDLPSSVWLPSVLVWQDVAVGLVFWLADRALRRPLLAWTAYALLIVWIAVNVVVTRALSSPLTLPMLRATGGALADSIGYYATAANFAMIAAVLLAGVLLPRVPWSSRLGKMGVIAVLAIAVPGPFAASIVDTQGAARNAVTALVATAVPRVRSEAAAAGADWRAAPFDASPADDLSHLRGRAAGRNVVMVILESTGAQYLHGYGAQDDPTPTLTTLARDAVQFESAYAVYPESVKGLFAVLCSRAPAFDVSVHAHAAAPCSPLPRTLGASGYRTALFHSGRFGYLGMDALIARQGFDVMADAGAIGGNVESSFGVDEPATVARMLSWIDGLDRTRPFFLLYMPVAGHHPYATPEPGPFADPGDLGAYKNALHLGDRSLRVLLDGLRTRGIDRQTLFVLFGDHGEAFGQHDGNFGHTLFAYEENVRVPLVMSMPGVTTPVRARQIASVLDIGPTVLDLVDVQRPRDYQGGSLLSGPSRMALFYTDYALGWVGLRDGCWKFLHEVDGNRAKLFDVCADPGETRDRAAEHPARLTAYRERALGWLAANRAALLHGAP